METQAFWRCQNHGLMTKDSKSYGADPEPRRRTVWIVDDRAREVELSVPFGAQKIMIGSHMLNAKLFTLLDLGFALN